MKKFGYILSCLLLCLTSLILLSACNESSKYKINFIVNEEIYQTISTNGNESITMPESPSIEGYKFEGWYFDKDVWKESFTKDSLLNIKLTEDISIYSKWIENDELKGTDAVFEGFEKAGDAYIKKIANNIEYLDISQVISIAKDSSWTLNTDIEANNPINSKVAPLNIGDNIYYVLVTDKNQNVKLYILNIRRKPLYKLRFLNGNIIFDVQYIEEENLVNFPISTPTKYGYTFDGWDFDFNTEITSDLDINAIFYLTKYNINYVLNGGDNHENNISTYDINTDVEIYEPTRQGYTFIGWYDNKDFKGYAKTEIQKNSSGDLELFANWIDSTYISEEYTTIYNVTDFINFMKIESNWDKNIRLFANLDFSNKNCPIIGTTENYFSGVLDGNGFVMSNLNKPLIDALSGTVKNLGLENININVIDYGSVSIGGLVNTNNQGEIINCYVTGEITGSGTLSASVGGLVGFSWGGKISNCYSTATIIAECSGSSWAYAGGLVGNSASIEIENSFFVGEVLASHSKNGTAVADSIIASTNKNVTNCKYLESETTKEDILDWTNENWEKSIWIINLQTYPLLRQNILCYMG